MTNTTVDTPTNRTAGTTRVPMGSVRKSAFFGGAFYVLTFAASIPALFLLAPVLNDRATSSAPGPTPG
jgi:hypothetical protein